MSGLRQSGVSGGRADPTDETLVEAKSTKAGHVRRFVRRQHQPARQRFAVVLAWGIARGVAAFVVVGMSFTLSQVVHVAAPGAQAAPGWNSPAEGLAQPAQKASEAEVLARRHRCWSGDAPQDMVGKVPRHVVTSRAGGEARYRGAREVKVALDQIFGDAATKTPGLTVHAFCR